MAYTPTQHISAEQREQFIQDGCVTRTGLLERMGVKPDDPDTWAGISTDPDTIAFTEACRTPMIEAVATELVGPDFIPGVTYSPFLDSQGMSPVTLRGFIPVLSFPKPSPAVFEPPTDGYHIDGMHAVGSHRQVFEHWLATGAKGDTAPPALDYADPIPLPGKAGDVIFMHYLLVHSGSANHDSHIRVGLNTAVMPDLERLYQPKHGSPQSDWTPLDWSLRTDTLRERAAYEVQ